MMLSKKQIRDDFTASTQELLSLLNDFPEVDFNTKPSANAWSAGEVAEHLIKVEVGTARFFTGQTKVADRNPEEKINPLRDTFLNFDTKMIAHGPIVPDNNPKNKQKAIDKLQDNRQRLTSMIEGEDLTEILADFDHPLFGPLTRVEWLYFHVFHSQRHGHQLRNINRQIRA